MGLVRNDLLQRLDLHEDSFVERKPEGGDFKPTIVAFANSVPVGREALLFLGVRNDGEALGLSNPDALQKKLKQFCRDHCYPPVNYTTELLPYRGNQVLAVVVTASGERPHFAGPAWVRVGSENLRAESKLFEALVTSRSSKAAFLLRHCGQSVSLATLKARLGQVEFARVRAGTTMQENVNRGEARVVEVTPFYARFEYAAASFSEPLRNLDLSWDDEKHRPLVVVHLDRA